jgi:hypothetical protein
MKRPTSGLILLLASVVPFILEIFAFMDGNMWGQFAAITYIFFNTICTAAFLTHSLDDPYIIFLQEELGLFFFVTSLGIFIFILAVIDERYQRELEEYGGQFK